MAGAERLLQLNALAAEYDVRQKPQTDDWPLVHQDIFHDIQRLSRTTFREYEGDTPRSFVNEPWKRQNLFLAEWLASKATCLNATASDENAWRSAVEDVILQRFFETACLRCKDQISRSDVELIQPHSRTSSTKKRKRGHGHNSCECPLDERIRDLDMLFHQMEISDEEGANNLFDHGAEDTILHEGSEKQCLLQQRPNRIIGFREKNDIFAFLNKSPGWSARQCFTRLCSDLRLIPSEQHASPLLPFLIVGARSHTAHETFSNMQTEASLLIQSLLKLQKDFWKRGTCASMKPEPLVWFLGYVGSDWRLCACYISQCGDSKTTCEIHQLESGDFQTLDGALQLFLLIDYIVDWAREVFRPSVLLQLRSLAIGTRLDEVTFKLHGDVESKRRCVDDSRTCNSATLQDNGANYSASRPQPTGDQVEGFMARLPKSQLGTVQPVTTMVFQCTGLRITAGNVACFLPRNREMKSNGVHYNSLGRRLLYELISWDETLILRGGDLENLEYVWTNKPSDQDPLDEGPDAEYYVVIQYRCFLNLEWKIIRELSYFAVSKAAFSTLEVHSAIEKEMTRERVEAFPENARPCSDVALLNAMECLRSGSAWQVLCSALSSTLFCLYPNPEKNHCLLGLRVETLAFGYTRSNHMKALGAIVDIARLTLRPQYVPEPGCYGMSLPSSSSYGSGKTVIVSKFLKTSEKTAQIPDQPHDADNCSRCLSCRQDLFTMESWDQSHRPSRSAHNALLVASLEEEPIKQIRRQVRHGLCLFVFTDCQGLPEDISIQTIIEDLGQRKQIYHTIRHDSSVYGGESGGLLWNLPWPYRRSTSRQRFDIARWVKELNGRAFYPTEQVPVRQMHLWEYEQMLLHFLRNGLSYNYALAAVKAFQEDAWDSYRATCAKDDDDESLSLHYVQIGAFWNLFCGAPRATALPEMKQLHGDV